jgi:hypothetical protein
MAQNDNPIFRLNRKGLARRGFEILDEAEREPDYITYWLFRMNDALASNDMDTALAAATEFKAAIEDEEIPLEWRDWYQGISQVI